MKVYFIISTFLLVTLSCITDSIKEISVKDLKKVLTSKNEKVQLVDVRTKEEYQKERIQNSVLIDIKMKILRN
ncbi:rhodanese-like domain-containing protein [Tenacibaculum maritimum]